MTGTPVITQQWCGFDEFEVGQRIGAKPHSFTIMFIILRVIPHTQTGSMSSVEYPLTIVWLQISVIETSSIKD
jgi:hypothetical protein